MLHPDKVNTEAKKKEKENIKFRNYLKNHAEEEELDQQFLKLHNELFKDYDCSKCRNCCKMYKGSIPAEDIERDAKCLNISMKQFIEFFWKNQSLVNIRQSISPATFYRKMAIANWVNADRRIAKIILILINRNDYGVCTVC